MKKPDFTLILPCYNEGPTFEKSVTKIISSLRGRSYRILFVEDGSDDETKIKVENLTKKIRHADAIYHGVNMGRGRSVADGIRASKTDICGFMDVDCEVSPTYIPLFVKEINSGADIAVGKRFYEKKWKSFGRVLSSELYRAIVKTLIKLPVDDTEAGYKFFNRSKILKVLKKVYDEGWFWDTEICARSHAAGLKLSQIPVLFIKRYEKKSTVKLIPDSIEYLIKLMNFKSQLKHL